MIKINQVSNGWILTTEDVSLQADETPQTVVFQYKEDDESDEVETFRNLLLEVIEVIGPQTSRYSKKKIYIEIKPGDKVEG